MAIIKLNSLFFRQAEQFYLFIELIGNKSRLTLDNLNVPSEAQKHEQF